MRNRNYVNSSVALQLNGNAIPKERYLHRKKKEKKKYARLRYAPSINFLGFILLMICAVAFATLCVNYIKIYDELKTCEKSTNAIMKEANALKLANDNVENSIYSDLNLEKLRKTAIKKLGMVYPSKKQIISYESVASSYVRQFGELKNNNKKNILNQILNSIANK